MRLFYAIFLIMSYFQLKVKGWKKDDHFIFMALPSATPLWVAMALASKEVDNRVLKIDGSENPYHPDQAIRNIIGTITVSLDKDSYISSDTLRAAEIIASGLEISSGTRVHPDDLKVKSMKTTSTVSGKTDIVKSFKKLEVDGLVRLTVTPDMVLFKLFKDHSVEGLGDYLVADKVPGISVKSPGISVNHAEGITEVHTHRPAKTNTKDVLSWHNTYHAQLGAKSANDVGITSISASVRIPCKDSKRGVAMLGAIYPFVPVPRSESSRFIFVYCSGTIRPRKPETVHASLLKSAKVQAANAVAEINLRTPYIADAKGVFKDAKAVPLINFVKLAEPLNEAVIKIDAGVSAMNVTFVGFEDLKQVLDAYSYIKDTCKRADDIVEDVESMGEQVSNVKSKSIKTPSSSIKSSSANNSLDME